MSRTISIELVVTEEQVQRLKQLLPFWRDRESEDGGQPFQNWTFEDMFRLVMQVGCTKTINNKIEAEEWRQSVLKSETPATGIAGESSN